MKVALLVRTRIWGGLETHLLDFAYALRRAAHVPIVGCIGEQCVRVFKERDASLPIVALPLPSTGTGSVLFWRRVLRCIEADACVFEKGTLHSGSLGLDVAARLVFPVFITIEQFDPPPLPPRTSRRHAGNLPGVGFWWYRQKLLGWCRSLAPQRTICVGPTVAEGLVNQYGFRRSHVQIISNGIDTARYPWPPGQALHVRQEYQIPAETTVFGTLGRLVQDKGIDVALDAFARLRVGAPQRDNYLLIVGDGTERNALQSQAAALGIADRVRFAGYVSAPARIYPAIDIFLQPSRQEPQGITVLEALASGCEVIASAVGGIPGMIPAPELGTLVPAEDADALAGAMARALGRSRVERCERAALGRRHVEQNFCAERQYGAIVDILQELRRH